jgi:ATP-dependent Clp protease protease subunit
LLSGTKGKRFCTPNATILLHGVKGSVSCVNPTDMGTFLNGCLEAHQKRVENIILKRTKITKIQLKDIVSKDTWLSAEECLKLGIVDYIIRKPNDLYSKINI